MSEPLALDSAQACEAELSRLYSRLAQLPHKWATKTAELHKLEQALAGVEAQAFLGADGSTATERKAQANATLIDNSLVKRVAELRGEVEGLRRIAQVIERQASIAQSLLAYHREEGKYQ